MDSPNGWPLEGEPSGFVTQPIKMLLKSINFGTASFGFVAYARIQNFCGHFKVNFFCQNHCVFFTRALFSRVFFHRVASLAHTCELTPFFRNLTPWSISNVKWHGNFFVNYSLKFGATTVLHKIHRPCFIS